MTKTAGRESAFRGPRIRNRGAVIVATIIATLISANVGLMVIRGDDTSDTPKLPAGANPLPSPTSASSTAATNRNLSTRHGVFVGNNKAAVRRFETWLGTDMKDVVIFDGRETWNNIANPNISQWKKTDYRLIFAVPMLPDSEKPSKEASMRAGARGEYNEHFTELAENLVAAGQENAVLRIGWEFNLKEWAWGIKDHEVFKKFFRQVVTTMRAVPGAKFKIDWNVNNGYNPYDGKDYYPGDKYVDYVGVDAYDLDASVYPYPKKCDADCRLTMQKKAWDELTYGGPRGLNFWASFATEHKKPLTLPEYALWKRRDKSGGEDNPYYIQQMYDFITWAPHNVAYAAYFNLDGPDGPHSVNEAFPDGGKVFLDLFGAKKKK